MDKELSKDELKAYKEAKAQLTDERKPPWVVGCARRAGSTLSVG
jgi:hypothetical protein